jgi:hypothetical protein
MITKMFGNKSEQSWFEPKLVVNSEKSYCLETCTNACRSKIKIQFAVASLVGPLVSVKGVFYLFILFFVSARNDKHAPPSIHRLAS